MTSREPIRKPSQFQLALALAVAKSKPASVTVREQITKIRQHWAQGTIAQDCQSREQYLGAADYWHTMYQDSQREIDHLQTRILLIEREKSKLEDEIRMTQCQSVYIQTPMVRPSTAQPKSSTTKRKIPPFKDDSTLPHKKPKTGNEVALALGASNPAFNDDLAAIEDAGGLDASIARHLYNIHELYQRILPDSSALAYHLIQAAGLIAEHVATTAIKTQEQLLQASLIKNKLLRAQRTTIIFTIFTKDFKDIQCAAVRSFTSLYHGLNTLWTLGTESGRRNHGVATYEMIRALNALLCAVDATCHTQAKMLTAEEAVSLNKDNGSDVKKKYKIKRIDKAPVPQEVTTTLLALLSGLTASQNGPHTAVFDGYLYLLLERTAKILFLLTFKHPQGATIEDDIALSNIRQSNRNDAAFKAATLEVQFLVQLVERAMTLAPGFLGALSLNASKASRPGTSLKSNAKNDPRRVVISVTAKEKLQHTLVRCMFGDFPRSADGSDTADEEATNNEFVEVLRRPVQIGPLPPPPRVEGTADIPHWFLEEMWRLIGWDILSREDGW